MYAVLYFIMPSEFRGFYDVPVIHKCDSSSTTILLIRRSRILTVYTKSNDKQPYAIPNYNTYSQINNENSGASGSRVGPWACPSPSSWCSERWDYTQHDILAPHLSLLPPPRSCTTKSALRITPCTLELRDSVERVFVLEGVQHLLL